MVFFRVVQNATAWSAAKYSRATSPAHGAGCGRIDGRTLEKFGTEVERSGENRLDGHRIEMQDSGYRYCTCRACGGYGVSGCTLDQVLGWHRCEESFDKVKM